MKLTVEIDLNLNTERVRQECTEAVRLGLRDTIVAIHNDVVSPPPVGSPVDTGHNRRSIASEVSGMGTVVQGDDAEPERVVNDQKLEAACCSTSGYGGFLETGTYKMPARPYFRPALDRHAPEIAENIRRHLGS